MIEPLRHKDTKKSDILGNRATVEDSLNNVTRTYTPNAANEYTQIGAGEKRCQDELFGLTGGGLLWGVSLYR